MLKSVNYEVIYSFLNFKDLQLFEVEKEILKLYYCPGLKMVKRNYDWVVERCELLEKSNSSRVVILLGSQSDLPFSANITDKLNQLGITSYTRCLLSQNGVASYNFQH